jgi:hypothetical protein
MSEVPDEKKNPVVGLPTYEEAKRKIDEGRATALDRFIYLLEPAGSADKNKFRGQLSAVLAEAESRFSVLALYARLRGVCPYCEGTDVVGPMNSADVERGEPGTRIRVPTECENCGSKWLDVYDLYRVVTLSIGGGR